MLAQAAYLLRRKLATAVSINCIASLCSCLQLVAGHGAVLKYAFFGRHESYGGKPLCLLAPVAAAAVFPRIH